MELEGKDKTYVVERRGGYPLRDGYFNQNQDAQLPKTWPADGAPATVIVRMADPVRAEAHKVGEVLLDIIFFGASDTDLFEVRMNGTELALASRDPAWKDPQIFSPRTEPASGGKFARYRIDPSQKLLKIRYTIDPQCTKVGRNEIEIRRIVASAKDGAGKIDLEKLEVHVLY